MIIRKIKSMGRQEIFTIFNDNTDKVIVPINQEEHWYLVVVDLKEKKITLYDSLCQNRSNVLDYFRDYLVFKAKDDGVKVEYDWSIWKDDWSSKKSEDCPEQENCSDCEVFTLCYALCILTSRYRAKLFNRKTCLAFVSFALEIHKRHLQKRVNAASNETSTDI